MASSSVNPNVFKTVDEPPSAGAWWSSPGFIAVAMLLAVLPLLWPAIPPLIDLPSHMGSYHIALNIGSSAALQKYYDFHWEMLGNLGVDLLVVPFAKVFGVELATKLIVILIAAMSVAGMLWIAKEIHGELPATVGFALPLAYCYPLLFGFVNYCLSMALMLLAFGLWLRLAKMKRLGLRAVLFAFIAAAMWVTHAIGWGLLVVACGCAELHRRIVAGEAWASAVFRAAVTCAPLCTPLLIMASLPQHKPSTMTGWFYLPELAKWLVTLFRDRWVALDLVSAAIFFLVLVLALLGRSGMRMRSSLAFPAAAMLALFVVAPQSINDSGFVNGRIAPYALALLVLAIGTRGATPTQRRRLAIAASAFFVVRTIATTASMAFYSASFSNNLQALDHVEPGSAIVSLAPVPCDHGFSNWWNPRLYHLSGMAIVRKDAFVNSEWQIDGLQILRSKYDAAKPFDRDPSEMVTLGCDMWGAKRYEDSLGTFPRRAFDYLWLLGIPARLWPTDSDLTLVWSNGDSALYRIAH